MLPEPEPAEYVFPKQPWWAARYLLPRMLVAGLAVGLAGAVLAGPRTLAGRLVFAGPALVLVWLLYRALAGHPPRLTLAPDEVRLEEAGATRTLRYAELRGLREVTQADGSRFLHLEPLAPDAAALTIGSDFAAYARIRELLAARLPDLTAGTAATAAAPASAGGTPVPRSLVLHPPAEPAGVETVLRWLAGAGVLALALTPPLLPYPLLLSQLLVAPLTAWALWRYPGRLRLTGDGTGAGIGLAPGLLLITLCGVGATLARFNYLNFRPLWLPTGAATLLMGLALLAAHRRDPRWRRQGPWALWVLLATAAGFGYMAAAFVNGAWPAAPGRRPGVIADGYRTTGKGAGSFLRLANYPISVQVGDAYYDQKAAGDTLTLLCYPGRLGADFYRVPPGARPGYW